VVNIKDGKKYGIMIFSALILALSFVGPASATTWSVDDSGEADFTRIQDAINNASDGDTIIVHSGVYYENVVVNKSVTLKGIFYPVVNAGGGGSAVTLTADGITVEGFNVTRCFWNEGGFRVISNSNNITGNNVYGNRYGIRVYNSSNNIITGNKVSNNVFGISLFSSSKNTITGNDASNNGGEGINLWNSSNNIITANNVCNNDGEATIQFFFCYDFITSNNLRNNGGGIGLYDSSNNNTITGNMLVNDGLLVYDSYQNRVKDNAVNGKPLVYLEDVFDYVVEDAGQIILVHCNNITVENLDLSDTFTGIELWGTKDCTISNSNVSNNRNGIHLMFSDNNIITGNTVDNNNNNGISIGNSSNNVIIGNTVRKNGEGIVLSSSCHNNSILANTG
jgi:parallel beta-helix repeat protein